MLWMPKGYKLAQKQIIIRLPLSIHLMAPDSLGAKTRRYIIIPNIESTPTVAEKFDKCVW